MRFVIGPVLLIIGWLWLQAAIRRYERNLVDSIASDIWDIFDGYMIHIVASVVVIIIGAVYIIASFNPDATVVFTMKFPFVSIQSNQPATQ